MYTGNIFRSPSISISTPASPPAQPSIPRIYATPAKGLDASETMVLIRWNCGNDNGMKIDRYQVQIQQMDSAGAILPGDPIRSKMGLAATRSTILPDDIFLIPSKNSTRVRPKSPDSKLEEEPPNLLAVNQDILSYHNWKIVYNNGDTKCYVEKPPIGVMEWIVRVRARNAAGWSEFSDTLVVNARTMPSFFPVLGLLSVHKAGINNMNGGLIKKSSGANLEKHESFPRLMI